MPPPNPAVPLARLAHPVGATTLEADARRRPLPVRAAARCYPPPSFHRAPGPPPLVGAAARRRPGHHSVARRARCRSGDEREGGEGRGGEEELVAREEREE